MPADIEIEISFGATKGLPGYSSERADERIRVTVHSEKDTVPDWLNDITSVETMLRNQCVFQVAESLGLEAAMSETGEASLVWPVPEASPPAQQLAPQPQPQTGTPGGSAGATSGGGGRGPAKVPREVYAALPRYAMDFGDGMKMYVDQRSLKNQGIYSAKAPDFKLDVPNGEGKWIRDQNGNIVLETQRAMAASNVPG